MLESRLDSEFLIYLTSNNYQPGDRVPPLTTLKNELGLSISKLREQLEAARMLGVVEVKPRSGIRCANYEFFPAIKHSLLFGLALDNSLFPKFGELRNHIEISFFSEAVQKLTRSDLLELDSLVLSAQEKLNGTPIRIPHNEHKDLHLNIFKKLENTFVLGLLEGYWEAYEAVDLNVYTDIQYLHKVWDYHKLIIQNLINNNIEGALDTFIEHTKLIDTRNK